MPRLSCVPSKKETDTETPPVTAGRSGRGYLFALLSAAAAGAVFVLGKPGITQVEPLLFAFLLSASALVLTIPVLPLMRESDGAPFSLRPSPVMLLHTLSVFVALWSMWAALKFLGPGLAAVLHRSELIFTVLIAMLFLKERLNPVGYAGMLVVVLGVVVLRLWASPLELTGAQLDLGIVLVLISSLAFAVSDATAKRALRQHSIRSFMLLRAILLVLVFGAAVLVRGVLAWPTTEVMLAAMVSAAAGPVLARLLFMYSLKYVTVTEAVLVHQLQPVFTALLALVFLGQVPGLSDLAGGLLILGGCMLVARSTQSA